MKTSMIKSLLFVFVFISFSATSLVQAQSSDDKPVKKSKEEKLAEKEFAFSLVKALVTNQQFVFKANFGPRSDEIFVVLDSTYAMVQAGNRNNLEGRVTKCEIVTNEKKRTISVTIMFRGAVSTADVFLFIGESGAGTATIKSDFPGYFSFDGQVVTFEEANIYEGKAIFVH